MNVPKFTPLVVSHDLLSAPPVLLASPTSQSKNLASMYAIEKEEFAAREKLENGIKKILSELLVATYINKKCRAELLSMHNILLTMCYQRLDYLIRDEIEQDEEILRNCVEIQKKIGTLSQKSDSVVRRKAYNALFQNRELKKNGWDIVKNPSESILVLK